MGLSVVSKNRLFRLIFLISILFICLGCGDTQNINIDQIPVETEKSSNSDVLLTEGIEEEFVVTFMFGEDEYFVTANDGFLISNETLPVEYLERILGIYYDSEFQKKYNNELIIDDIVLYVKLIDDSNGNIDYDKLEVIKQDYAVKTGSLIEDICIEHYIGQYNEYIVLMIWSKKEWYLQAFTNEIFDDIVISYPNSKTLLAYKDGVFYSLIELYEANQLSIEDILSIRYIYNHLY